MHHLATRCRVGGSVNVYRCDVLTSIFLPQQKNSQHVMPVCDNKCVIGWRFVIGLDEITIKALIQTEKEGQMSD